MKRASCESCEHWRKKDPLTLCGDCDAQYIMLDVRHYRALRSGAFKLKKKIATLEKKASKG